MSDLSKRQGLITYNLVEGVNNTNGMFQIGIDEVASQLLIHTNLSKFVFNKPVDFNERIYVNGDEVLTNNTIDGIEGLSVDMVDGLHVNDQALATTADNNAIYSGKKVKEMLKTDIVVNDIDYTNTAYPGVTTVQGALDELLYVPIKINSFSNNKSVNEKGSTATNIVFTWEINKIVVNEQKFDNVAITTSLRTKTVPSLSETKSFSLFVKDDKNSTHSSTSAVSFLNGRYFGVSSAVSMSNSGILALQKELVESKSKTFTVTAGSNQYIYFCLPKRLGTCKFVVGGFEGGFDIQPEINFTNASGFTETYYVYRSKNVNLGNTTVTVS